mgnify:CR=1 FL=1
MPRMFGTDGVRGLANRALTAQLALDLGDAAVRVLGDDGDKSEFDGRRRALVGRDTRVSGDFLAAALSAGMSAGGFDVIDAGIIPTPGVAYLTSVLNVEMGAVISASHNPMPDNGIKFFARGGFKLPDTKEDENRKRARSGLGTPDRCRRGTYQPRHGNRNQPVHRPSGIHNRPHRA